MAAVIVSYGIQYYISSLSADIEKISNAIRSHWGVENQLHWSIDVVFGEDKSRIRTSHGSENHEPDTKNEGNQITKSGVVNTFVNHLNPQGTIIKKHPKILRVGQLSEIVIPSGR